MMGDTTICKWVMHLRQSYSPASRRRQVGDESSQIANIFSTRNLAKVWTQQIADVLGMMTPLSMKNKKFFVWQIWIKIAFADHKPVCIRRRLFVSAIDCAWMPLMHSTTWANIDASRQYAIGIGAKIQSTGPHDWTRDLAHKCRGPTNQRHWRNGKIPLAFQWKNCCWRMC